MKAIIIIPADSQAAANEAALTLDPSGGQLTFTVPLFPAGQPQTVPSAYWAAASLSAERLAQVQALAATIPGATVEVWDPVLNPELPAQMLAARNLEVAQ